MITCRPVSGPRLPLSRAPPGGRPPRVRRRVPFRLHRGQALCPRGGAHRLSRARQTSPFPHTWAHVRTHTHTYITHTHTYTSTRVYTHVHMYARTHGHTHTLIRTCIQATRKSCTLQVDGTRDIRSSCGLGAHARRDSGPRLAVRGRGKAWGMLADPLVPTALRASPHLPPRAAASERRGTPAHSNNSYDNNYTNNNN